MISIRTSPYSPSKARSKAPRSQGRRMAARASLLNDIGAGIARIFTPFRTDNKEEFPENTGYTGTLQQKSKRTPFKDGWTSQPVPPPQNSPAASVPPSANSVQKAESTASEVETDSNNIVSFLGEATQNLVAHNFTGDETEPEHWQKVDEKNPRAGWSGDIRKRGKEGFHVSK